MAAAALYRILTPTPTSSLLLRRQLLLRLLPQVLHPQRRPHPAFLADRPLFSLSVHRLASAGRRDLVTSILSSSLTSASSFLRLPPPASPAATMALLVRARLSSLDEDDDAASSVSSSASPSRSPSPPLVSPTVRRAAVLGAPHVAAQLSFSTDDEKGEILDGAMDYGEEDEVLEEVSNGFLGVAEASLEEGFASAWSVGGVFDADVRSGLEDDTRGDQDVGAEAVNDVVPEPFIGFAGGIDGGGMRIVDALEGNDGGSEHEVAELPPVVNATEEEEDASLELRNGDSDAKDGTPKHEVVTDVEDAISCVP